MPAQPNEMRVINRQLVTGHVNRHGIFVDVRPVRLKKGEICVYDKEKLYDVHFNVDLTCPVIPSFVYPYCGCYIVKCRVDKIDGERVTFSHPDIDIPVLGYLADERARRWKEINEAMVRENMETKKRKDQHKTDLLASFPSFYESHRRDSRRFYSGDPLEKFKEEFEALLTSTGASVTLSEGAQMYKSYMKEMLK